MSEPALAQDGSSAVAVIGLAGRFPGARDVAQLWRNLREGVESISRLDDEQLRAAGLGPELLADPSYVKAAALLDDVDRFDAPLFGYSPAEAEIIDPQHRIFLECCWEALENAGYDPGRYPGLIGLYAGCSANTYLLASCPGGDPSRLEAGALAARLACEKDFLALRISYKLNLRGPSISVQTACSTSLVAVHLACQGLLNGECDIALAGGVAVKVPQEVGYLHEPGGILSPDGHCRPFDARAQGTLYGSGAGVVVLKRLPEALADRDSVYAVIRGSAINNDGAAKLGFTAPSVAGQARVFAEACAAAGIDPSQLDYIEAHGTGTVLGDPIEVEALTQVLRAATGRKGFCGIGSIKSNFGHLDAAAGVAGLIKTVLALAHREIPPTLHFGQPNPRLGLADSPLYVNIELRPWRAGNGPRRAGVSSFGIGGTNAHVVLEEAPSLPPPGAARRWQLLALSARTVETREACCDRLAARFQEPSAPNLADAAYTLLVGRHGLRQRCIVVGESLAEVGSALADRDPRRVLTGTADTGQQAVAFLFPGQGSQHAGMGLEIYREEGVFRTEVDRCCELLLPHLDLDLRTLLYPSTGEPGPLDDTWLAQPALFVVEYALARLWVSWGVQPAVMFGHSLGEYVAACLAGVFELADALALVAARGRLMQRLPRGGMLAVPVPEAKARELLGGQLALAAVNGPDRTVIAGPEEEVTALEARLRESGVASRRLRTSRAFHSPMAEPALAEFRRHVSAVARRPPELRYLSSVTGTWITAQDAVDPEYWVRQSREPVQMWRAVQELRRRRRILLEVGPGHTLSILARQVPQGGPVVTSLPHPEAGRPAAAHLLEALGRLWLAGVEVDWQAYFAPERRRRIALPTYPFERQRYWIDATKPAEGRPARPKPAAALPLSQWFSIPSWKRTLAPPATVPVGGETWLLLADASAPGAALGDCLRAAGCRVVQVEAGERFASREHGGYTLRVGVREDFKSLFADLRRCGSLPQRIVHTWCLGPAGIPADRDLDASFFSLLFLAQTLGEHDLTWPVELVVLSSGVHRVTGEETLSPLRATVMGPVRVIPLEYPHQVLCRNIDCLLPASGGATEEWLEPLARELLSGSTEPLVACRRVDRWVAGYEPVRLEAAAGSRLRLGGVCLITGGLGGIGLALAEHLAATAGARLVLTGLQALPPREQWDSLCAAAGTPGELRRKIVGVRRLEAGGAQVIAAAVDVRDRSAMAALVSEVLRRWGGLHGVIHCAGEPGGGMIQGRSRAAAERVLAPKVEGTLVLDELLAGRELDFFVLCSSLTAIWGGFGQVDYCSANAFLGCFAQSRAAADGRFTLAIEWGPWLETGMAARAGWQPAPGSGTPFLPEVVVETPELKVYRHRLDGGHWLVAEHRSGDTGLLPGTAYLEFARAAFARLVEAGTPVEMADVVIGQPLNVDGSGRLVYTALQPEAGGFRFSILSPAGADWQEHATGRIASWQPDEAPRADFSRLCRDLALSEIAPEKLRLTAVGPLQFGPRWHCLKRVQAGSRAAFAEIELDGAFAADLETVGLHPALLDVALAFACPAADEALYAPLSYGRVRVLRALPQRLHSLVSRQNFGAGSGETILFDALLLDPAGERLAEVDGFLLRRLEKGEELLNPQHPQPAVASHTGREAVAALAGGLTVGDEGRASGWISPADGVEAFARALACPSLPQVAVSPLPLEPVRPDASDQNRLPATAPASTARAPRPALATPYVPPRSERERQMARLWEELFGIDKVGLEDNFFELGGDSVLGLRLIAQAQKLGLDLPANQIFLSPTIASLAAMAAVPPTPMDGAPATPPAPPSAAGQGGYHLEDFAMAALTQEELDELISEYDPGAEARA